MANSRSRKNLKAGFADQIEDRIVAPSVMRTLDNQLRSLQIKEGLEAWKTTQGQHTINNKPVVKDIEDQSQSLRMESSDVTNLTKRLPRSISQPTIQDFTTEGLRGQLGCPFASKIALQNRQRSAQMSQAPAHPLPDSLPTPPAISEELANDPIAVEFHATDITSPPPSAAGSSFRCPIRFLDLHSPEEVAKYFENHKHEIPRSHEICVKRYQSNSESIRQLDAKYGNLVSMIQGLGMKHQPMLPTNEEVDGAWLDRQSVEKVKKWAASCTDDGRATEAKPYGGDSEERPSHFDRPLKEIRVGESPSRPWGISVPQAADSTPSEGPIQDDVQEAQQLSGDSQQLDSQGDVSQNVTSKGKCPFNHNPVDENLSNLSRSHREKPESSNVQVQIDEMSAKTRDSKPASSRRPRMLFTGPVFIGYSAEQAKALLQDCFQNMQSPSM